MKKYILLFCFMPCVLFAQHETAEDLIKNLIETTKAQIEYDHIDWCMRCWLQGKLEAYENAYFLMTDYDAYLERSSTN